jgi:hypothetical protein
LVRRGLSSSGSGRVSLFGYMRIDPEKNCFTIVDPCRGLVLRAVVD